MSTMWKPAKACAATVEQVEELAKIARSRTEAKQLVLRARIILLAAEGRANHAIARELGIPRPTVILWRNRFAADGVEGLRKERPRGRRFPPLPEQKVRQIIEATQKVPPGMTHWSTRTMAKAQGVSYASVRRIWNAHELKPHLVESFKLSTDPNFVEKVHDVVGLMLNPPTNALVLSVDEKSQIQALDRTQPGLPLKKGRAGTMTHDDKRNGTTTLFAALNVLTGRVLGRCMPRHTHQDFLRFREGHTW